MVRNIVNIFIKLWTKVSTLKIIFTDDNPLQSAGKDSSLRDSVVKECTRDAATRKRVAAAIEKQEQQMQIRALKPHDPTCKNPMTCSKPHCFIREPDKIVKTSVVKRPMTRGRLRSGCTKKISE